MTSLKNIIRSALRFYFVPFPYHSKFFFKIKDVYYTSPAEHLFRLVTLSKGKHTNANVVVDIGAADGLTAVFFTTHIPNCKVLAFEPNELIWPQLESNTKSNTAITIKKMALAESSGNVDLHVTANNLSSSLLELDSSEINSLPIRHQNLLEEKRVVSVQVSTLDEQLKNVDHILCLKLDVQGYELKILNGGLTTLLKTDFILVEMSNHHLYKGSCQYYEVDEFLRSLGFRLADIIVSYRTQGRVQEFDAIYERVGNHH